MASGIYKIVNKITGMIYIGQAVNMFKRKSDHFSALRTGRHNTTYLQNSWNVHEETDFEWSIVEYVEPDKKLLVQREQYWCDQYPFDQLYNSRVCSESNLGMKRSPETRSKMSAAHKIIQNSPEMRAKMSAIRKGKKKSPEHIAKLAKAKHKPILQIDLLTENVIKQWESITIAAKELEIDRNGISACAKGKLKSSGEYKWQYVN